MPDRKRRLVTWYHRHLANPLMRHAPGQVLLETVGRRSGQPRETPVGGRLEGDTFWLVSDHGHQSQYVRNIAAYPKVRVKVGGSWRIGMATPVPEDDPIQRLKRLPWFNSLMVRALGTDLLTVRVDLDPLTTSSQDA